MAASGETCRSYSSCGGAAGGRAAGAATGPSHQGRGAGRARHCVGRSGPRVDTWVPGRASGTEPPARGRGGRGSRRSHLAPAKARRPPAPEAICDGTTPWAPRRPGRARRRWRLAMTLPSNVSSALGVRGLSPVLAPLTKPCQCFVRTFGRKQGREAGRASRHGVRTARSQCAPPVCRSAPVCHSCHKHRRRVTVVTRGRPFRHTRARALSVRGPARSPARRLSIASARPAPPDGHPGRRRGARGEVHS